MQSAVAICLLLACLSGTTRSTDPHVAQKLEQPDAFNDDWAGSQLFPKPHVDGKIVGGTPAQIKDYPYQLSLRYRGRHVCGASIISPYYAVTAAHCIEGESASKFSLRSESASLYSGGSRHEIEKAVVHPDYTNYSEDYDIAIIQVTQPFKMSERAAPVVLPKSGDQVQPGTMAVVTGWGVTREGSFSPALQLQSVSVPIVDKAECFTNYLGYGDITPRMLCAGFRQGQKDACQGDSGGPLVADGVLIGVVSWGAGCARPGLPGVYTNLADPGLRAWITANTNGL